MDCIVPKGYNVMRHSQNKHREKSNIVSYFKGKTLSATLRKIRRNGEYGLVHCWLMLEDGTKRRVVFGQHNGKTFQEAWSEDLGIVLDAAQKLTMALPLASSAHQLYLGASGAGFGQQDDSAVIKLYAQMTGITLPAKAEKS
jgi:hypothetical protein